MPVTVGSILTAVGAADFAGSIAGLPVALSHVAFGDANGVAYTPAAGQVALVHEVVRVAVDSVVWDVDHPDRVVVSATVPAAAAGFDCLEVGVYAANGNLEAIAPAAVRKGGPGDATPTDLTLEISLIVGVAATVVVVLDGGAYATRDWALSAQDFFAVCSATVSAPPGAPSAGDQYLVPAGATGAWTSHGGQIAVWRNTATGWLFVPAPNGAMAQAADTAAVWRRRGGAWSLFLASAAEAVAGARADVAATPAGLAASDQAGAHTFAVAGGTANAITLALVPPPAGYVAGMPLTIRFSARNTGAVQVKVNDLATVDLVNARGGALRPGELRAGRIGRAVFDGAAFQLVSPPMATPAPDPLAFLLGAH